MNNSTRNAVIAFTLYWFAIWYSGVDLLQRNPLNCGLFIISVAIAMIVHMFSEPVLLME